jgi:hypothetical protein
MNPSLLDTLSTNMPSESTFKQQVERARVLLKSFNTIRVLDAPGPVKTAFDELSAIASDFIKFVPFFTGHPLFQEVIPAIHSALEDFITKNPNFEKPSSFQQVAGLNTRAQDALQNSAKKGMSSSYFKGKFLLTLIFLSCYCGCQPSSGEA